MNVLVTGGASGLGAAVVEAVHKAGGSPYVLDRVPVDGVPHGVVGFTRALAAELAGRYGVTLLVPGGMRTHFFDDRDEKYRPGPDAVLNDPANVAKAVLFALDQPAGCEIRELVVCAGKESSYP